MTASTWKKILFDLETNGLLETCTVVHCAVLKDLESGELESFGPHYEEVPGAPRRGILTAIRLLENAELLVGQNVIDYDLPVIAKLFPWARLQARRYLDTLILSKMVYPDIKQMDFACAAKWGMPMHLAGRHGLEAWGYRLRDHKGDYSKLCKEKGIDPWAAFSEDMLTYCVQDVQLNHKLLLALSKKAPPRDAVDMEMEYKRHAVDMERNGVPLDREKAVALLGVLTQRKEDLRREVEALFADWWVAVGDVTVKATRKVKSGGGFWRIKEKGKTKKADMELLTTGSPPPGDNVAEALEWAFAHPVQAVEFVPYLIHYDEGTVYTKVELRHFNPTSRDHIADRLQKLYGWRPTEFGKGGKPTIDDDILSELPFPPCKLLAEFFMVDKRLAALSTGKKAWLAAAKETDQHGRTALRVHGGMDTLGTTTSRCTHKEPNMGQVPSVENGDGVVPYGKECRQLFPAEKGFVMLGVDASGIQLRALGHNLAPYDEGAYAHIVATGDVHEANRIAAALDTRPRAKRFIYAYLFGGGGWKLGTVTGGVTEEELAGYSPDMTNHKRAVRHLEFVGLPPTPENIMTTLKGFGFKERFTKRTPGLQDMLKEITERASQENSIKALDGRLIPVRSMHSVLNFLLQSDEAILCKRWKVTFLQEMRKRGFVHGRDFVMHLDVHDEIQLSVLPHLAKEIGDLCVECIGMAGRFYGYRVPLVGEAKVGATWYETH